MNLKDLLHSYDVLVAYKAYKDEVDINKMGVRTFFLGNILYIPQGKSENPQSIANSIISTTLNKKVCIFVPGQAFDLLGNRKGRGGGWYDRFLYNIPKEWLRIGLIEKSKISLNKLEVNSWDQPVDWIASVDSDITLYETHARNLPA